MHHAFVVWQQDSPTQINHAAVLEELTILTQLSQVAAVVLDRVARVRQRVPRLRVTWNPLHGSILQTDHQVLPGRPLWLSSFEPQSPVLPRLQ